MLTICSERKGTEALLLCVWLRACRLFLQRPEYLEHAMQCFARLARLLLGKTAIAEKKLEFGLTGLEVLGVCISMSTASV